MLGGRVSLSADMNYPVDNPELTIDALDKRGDVSGLSYLLGVQEQLTSRDILGFLLLCSDVCVTEQLPRNEVFRLLLANPCADLEGGYAEVFKWRNLPLPPWGEC